MTLEIRPIRLDEAWLLKKFNESRRGVVKQAQLDQQSSEKTQIDLDSFKHKYLNNPYFNRKLDSSIMGAFINGELNGILGLCPQPLHLRDSVVDFAWLQGWYVGGSQKRPPGLGLLLLDEAQKYFPNVASLGIGGPKSDVFKLYRAMKWTYHGEIPFFFDIMDPRAFLAKFVYLHRSRYLKIICKGASLSIIIPLMMKVYSSTKRTLRKNLYKKCQVQKQESFGGWSDKIWVKNKGHYPAILERMSNFLNWRFPERERYNIFRVVTPNKGEGYFVVKTTEMIDEPRFGCLFVGTIVDYFCSPESVAYILASASELLEIMGSELVMCNFSHDSAVRALPRLGFFPATSNYTFVSTNTWIGIYKPNEIPLEQWYISRGDSDGDGNL